MYIVQNEDGTKVEYRIWNPFRSKLAAAVLGGVDNIWIVSDFVLLKHNLLLDIVFQKHYIDIYVFYFIKKPGAKVLYLGAASGTTVSHVSDIVGPVSVHSNCYIYIFFYVCCVSLMGISYYVYVDRSCVCSRILPSKWT